MQDYPNFSDELADAISRSTSIIVALPSGRSMLSGVYWRPGIVVTTIDVRRCRGEITLMTQDGEAKAASLVGVDPGTDIAVLRVDATDSPMPELADLNALRLGHLVLALGLYSDFLFDAETY
jgi:S1-C subfamily serine protease